MIFNENEELINLKNNLKNNKPTNIVKDLNSIIYNLDSKNRKQISDKYHSFDDLYNYRMMYNAGFFNLLNDVFNPIKSKKHNDGELCFNGESFIVCINIPELGQIDNHYNFTEWDYFNIPEVEKSPYKFDNHTSKMVEERMKKLLLNFNYYKKLWATKLEVDFK
jgi:hypothetical protein